MLRLRRELGYLALRVEQLLVRVLAVSLGLSNLAVGVLNVAGNLLRRARHLGNGRRHLLGLGILLGNVRADLTGGTLQVYGQILQSVGGIVHPPQYGPDAGLQQLDVKIGDGAGLLTRVDKPGQTVIFIGQLPQIARSRDELVAVETSQQQEWQSHIERSPGSQLHGTQPGQRQQS